MKYEFQYSLYSSNKMKNLILKIVFLSFLILSIAVIKGQNADINLLREINLERNTAMDGSFRMITNSATPFAFGTPIVLFGIGLIAHDSITKRKALYVGASVLTSSAIATILKYSIKRPRPFVTYPEIDKATAGGSPSLPSGHTSDAFALATSVSLVYTKWYVIAPSFLWASAVGYSRMDLGVHYPSDVLMGAIIGSGSAWLCYQLNKKIKVRSKKTYVQIIH
jgi:membrane-associated phospholipid phosphatase